MALDFLILYEHIVREYESITLLKAELERRGYTAEIRQLLAKKERRLHKEDKPKVVRALKRLHDIGVYPASLVK